MPSKACTPVQRRQRRTWSGVTYPSDHRGRRAAKGGRSRGWQACREQLEGLLLGIVSQKLVSLDNHPGPHLGVEVGAAVAAVVSGLLTKPRGMWSPAKSVRAARKDQRRRLNGTTFEAANCSCRNNTGSSSITIFSVASPKSR